MGGDWHACQERKEDSMPIKERRKKGWRACQGMEEGDGVVLSQGREAGMPGEGEFQVPAGKERKVLSLAFPSGKEGRQSAYQ